MSDTFDDSQPEGERRGLVHVPQLTVLLECDRPAAGGLRCSLEGVSSVTIGRGDRRELIRRPGAHRDTLDLRLPGRSLSEAHARLVCVGTSWAIEDTGSKNGTFVNGSRIERRILASGDVCEAGHVLFAVEASAPMLADAPPVLDMDGSGQGGDMGLATLDPLLRAQMDTLGRLAVTDVPILINGASGTGKEVLARWVHARTGRRGKFVAVNCGAIPAQLLESTLFGHVKGSFSGATRDEIGFLRAAHGGTVFLDEIAELRRDSQAALLRALQEREVVPVGATEGVPVDIRIVAATHTSLKELVERGDYRQDLFARIAGFTVTIPPLRERRRDFGVLVASLLRRIDPRVAEQVSFAPEVGRRLLAYPWPQNVRELQQCLTTCLALRDGPRIELAHLPPWIAEAAPSLPDPERPPQTVRFSPKDDRLRLELLAQLAQHHGNLADVARAMGKARMQVHRWCRRFGVDPNVYRR